MCASVGAVLGSPSTSLAGSYLLFSFLAPLASWRFVLWAGPRQPLNFVGRLLSPLFFHGALGVLAVPLLRLSIPLCPLCDLCGRGLSGERFQGLQDGFKDLIGQEHALQGETEVLLLCLYQPSGCQEPLQNVQHRI
jgi:hypothetical protein